MADGKAWHLFVHDLAPVPLENGNAHIQVEMVRQVAAPQNLPQPQHVIVLELSAGEGNKRQPASERMSKTRVSIENSM